MQTTELVFWGVDQEHALGIAGLRACVTSASGDYRPDKRWRDEVVASVVNRLIEGDPALAHEDGQFEIAYLDAEGRPHVTEVWRLNFTPTSGAALRSLLLRCGKALFCLDVLKPGADGQGIAYLSAR